MTVLINHSPIQLDPTATVADALLHQNMAGNGIAVAVDNKVVSRDKWETTRLYENAKLTVIRAVCGG
ncbi:MAG: sulfur carrier protein ThiS [Muribaculum sp.]|nr:sulfur carrier protein ThiS [Muribaculaceae bacterium]MCM1081555.1 sulfur carrier protein ThiS [Muribaculum sp.]